MSDRTINKIWYISKYAVSPKYGDPSRHYFFSKYMFRNNRNVTLVGSRSIANFKIPKLGFSNQEYYESEGVKGVLINGPQINLGFNIKRILSWAIFEVRLLYWAIIKNKERPDVIIVSSLSLLTFFSGYLLKLFYRCKLVCEVRDIWPLTIIETKGWNSKNIFVRLLFYVERLGYRKADLIVGTMPNLKEYINNISPKLGIKVAYVPTGFDEEFWLRENNKSIENFFERFIRDVIPTNHFIVGYAGSIGYANCVEQILDAALNLKDKPISFIILGSGVLKEKLADKAKKLSLYNFHFLDAVPKKDVQLFLEQCDLLVNPWNGANTIYKYGVSPNKWIDYMFSSRPILVSLNGYHNIINEAGCGEFIEADDVNELAKAIYRFSKMEKEELDNMGRQGKKYMFSNLTYDVLSKKYLDLIDKLE